LSYKEEDLIRSLQAFEQNARWFSENCSEVAQRYEGKAIAIKDRKVVAVGDSLDEVLSELEMKGEDVSSAYVTVVPKRTTAFIL
jgi:hypothetical protein